MNSPIPRWGMHRALVLLVCLGFPSAWGAAALLSPGLVEPAAERRARLQAAIAAEPHRVKELLHEAGVDWCGMAGQTRLRNPIRLMAGGLCQTEGPSDEPANRDLCIPGPNTPFKTLRLNFVVFRNDDGSAAAASPAQVEAQVQELNSAYAASRIRFTHSMEYVNSSRFRSLSYFVNSEEAAMKQAHANRPDQQHNVYVTEIEPDPERGGSLLGVSTFPWDPTATGVGGGTILDDDSIGAGQRTLVHELGHALGLWHTHHGVREVEQCSACWERADGVDADTTGDFCSDTPPTPVNYKCQGPGGNDPCSGRAWGATAPQNYMGYAPDSCYTEFTLQQAGRMHCWIGDRLSGWMADDQAATVTIAATDPTASEEGPDTGTVTVTRTGPTVLALNVRVTRGGTATQGADYAALGETVTILEGSASATIRVTPINDTQSEPDETVVFTVAAGAGYQVGAPASATVTIADNDAPTGPVATVVATDATASERGADPAVFTITRTGPTAEAMTVRYAVTGTAVAADYTPALGGSVVVPAGSASATLQITPVDDTQQEPTETVVVTLQASAGYSVGTPASATAELLDDDTPVSQDLLAENFDRVTVPALPGGWASTVGGAGSPWGTAQYAELSPPNVVVAQSVPALSDIRLASPAFTVPSAGARLVFDHGFLLEEFYDGGVLEISIGGAAFQDIVAAGGSFESGGYVAVISGEGDSPITGRGAWTGATQGNIRTSVLLPPGAAGREVRLLWRLVSDIDFTEDGGGWGLDNIAVTSLGGGGATVVTVSVPDGSASEAGGDTGTFTLVRSGSVAAALSVSVTVSGTASAGADYAAISGTVVIPAGSGSVNVTVTPVNDTAAEGVETVVLTVVPGAGYSPGNPASGTVTLLDDEGGGAGVVFTENFDGVQAPSLPSGWTAQTSAGAVPWATTRYDGLTPPNIVFAGAPEYETDNALVSPTISIATGEARLVFDHGYALEEGYDGAVLEISIGGGVFRDILEAGGSFVSGGYDGRISTTDGSLIAGRAAWTGEPPADVKTEVRLPAAAAGKTVRLRWRLVTDGGIAGVGWGIDNVSISEAAGGGGGLPVVSVTAVDGNAAEYGPDTGEWAVSRTGATAAPLTVQVVVAGSATAGVDYAAIAGTVTIPAGSSTASVRVTPVNDSQLEGPENVVLTIQPAPEYAIGSDSRGEVVLLDNGPTAPVVFGANFDDVTEPAIPTGWSVNLNGAGNPWRTFSGGDQTAPNIVYAPDPDAVSDNALTTPPIAITGAGAQLVFIHDYSLEPGYDGGVLEIALGSDANAAFRDILEAGGTFVSGGYDGPISLEDGSPVAGRAAWTGDSRGPRVTRVNLPAAAAGQVIRLRWRCASDAGVADLGWGLDTVIVTEPGGAAGSADLAVTMTGSASQVQVQERLTYTITVTNRSAVAARDVVLSNTLPANVRLVSATPSQGTVSGTGTQVAHLGILNSRASASLVVVVVPDAAGTVTASAQVSATETDPDPGNNRATVATVVLPTATPSLAFTNAAALTIPETAGPSATYPLPIQVAGFQGGVGRVAVTLHGLTHSFPDDLDILLVGPGGRKVMLMSDAGGDQRYGMAHVTITFVDDAPEPLPDRSAIASGLFRPTDFEAGEDLPAPAPPGSYGTSLAVFNGIDPNGTWQLYVADDESKDGGRLAGGWSLTITRAAANATPPVITVQPQSRIVAAGATVTLSVAATGTPPPTYQWRRNGGDIPGATGASLVLAAVTPAQSGDYTVRVVNDGGVVLSQSALLTVTSQARQLRLGSASAAPTATAQVPVVLSARGDESRLRFSIGFDPERLGFSSVAAGSGAGGASLSLNVNQLESGRFGVQLSQPPGQVFRAGDLEVVVLTFEARPRAAGEVTLMFVDAPMVREVVGATAQVLPADYLPGSVSIGTAQTGPRLGALSFTGTGAVQFTITGTAGGSIRVETSSDLRAWTPAATLPNPGGTVTYTGAAPAAAGPQFYRAVQLP